ncbi:MAG: hypothetical protein EP330_21415 [Deltaproteobacteria bacterium]|nr:MAG: hypothetical protein EP330_21415 [Deltaproteobacteria bacterium]
MRFATIAMTALFSTALAGTAIAGAGGPRFAEALDLTAEQQAVVDGFKDEMEAARSEVRSAGEALQEAIKADMEDGEPNVKALKKYVDAKIEAERDLAYLRLEHLAELSEVLTDEQLAELAEMREQRQARRGEGHRGRGGHGEFKGEGGRWEKSGDFEGGKRHKRGPRPE